LLSSAHLRVASAAFAGESGVFDHLLLVVVIGQSRILGEAVALFADADLVGRGDVPRLEQAATPGMAALAVDGIESLGFGVLAVALEVVAIAENSRAGGAVLGRVRGVDPARRMIGSVSVDPVCMESPNRISLERGDEAADAGTTGSFGVRGMRDREEVPGLDLLGISSSVVVGGEGLDVSLARDGEPPDGWLVEPGRLGMVLEAEFEVQ